MEKKPRTRSGDAVNYVTLNNEKDLAHLGAFFALQKNFISQMEYVASFAKALAASKLGGAEQKDTSLDNTELLILERGLYDQPCSYLRDAKFNPLLYSFGFGPHNVISLQERHHLQKLRNVQKLFAGEQQVVIGAMSKVHRFALPPPFTVIRRARSYA